jgi:K+-transporting ATPase ATPase C chain
MVTRSEIEEPPDTQEEAEPTGRRLAREARAALVVTLVLGFLGGGLFPALVLGLSQLLLPDLSNGSLVRNAQGEVIGSKLVGQRFQAPQYFHGRASAAGADGYDAAASSGLNLGPTNAELAAAISERGQAYRTENAVAEGVELPADALTTSASGLDPHISPANAFLQVSRVATARGMSETAVRELVEEHLKDRVLGFFGEPRVNVLLLNLALDEAGP